MSVYPILNVSPSYIHRGGVSYQFVKVEIDRVMLFHESQRDSCITGDIQSIVSLAFWSRASSPADDIVVVIAKQSKL